MSLYGDAIAALKSVILIKIETIIEITRPDGGVLRIARPAD
jgi:hypothetical protein